MMKKKFSRFVAVTMSAALMLSSMPDVAFAVGTGTVKTGYENLELSKTSEPDYEGFIEAWQKSFDNYEKEIDVSAYNIPGRDVGSLYQTINARDPRYFYVKDFNQTLDSSGNAEKITNKYISTISKTKNIVARYDAAVTNALAGIGENWTDVEKVLYINDYIALNTEFDDTKEGMCSNSYGALVDGKADRYGYSYAFQELAQQSGIKVGVVYSSSLKHTWNMVKIGDSYYNVDVTWNDSESDVSGRVMHKYLLKSDEYFKSEEGKHNSNDWMIDLIGFSTKALDTSLDSCEWNNINAGLFKVGNLWYTVDTDRGGICSYEFDSNTLKYKENVLTLNEQWPSGELLVHKIAAINDVLYYSTPNSVISYNPETKEKETFYTLTDEQKENGSIFGLKIDLRGNVSIYVAQDSASEGKTFSAGKIEPSREPVEPTTVEEVEEYESYPFGTHTLTTIDEEKIVIAPSDRPKIVGFTNIGCSISMRAFSKLETMDLSDIDVILADVNGIPGKWVKEIKDEYYIYANQTKFCYDGKDLIMTVKPVGLRAPSALSITPLILYLDKDNNVVYHTLGNDPNVIEHVEKYLGVKLKERMYGDIARKTTVLSSDKYIYTGEAIKPDVIVLDNDGSAIPEEEYIVSYENNVDAGTGTVIVKGNKNLAGETRLNFEIGKADYNLSVSDDDYILHKGEKCQLAVESDAGIEYKSNDESVVTVDESGMMKAVGAGNTSITVSTKDDDNHYQVVKNVFIHVKDTGDADNVSLFDCTVSDITEKYVYDGTEKVPDIEVKDGSKILKEGVDYTLSYSKNTDAGTGYVTITGRGGYSDVVTKTFTIEKTEQKVTAQSYTDTMEVGDSIRFTISAEGALSFESSDNRVATVDRRGRIRAVGEGEVTITVNAAETVNYKSASTDVKLNVKERSKEKTDLSGKAVLYTSVTTYDGTAKEPKVKVMVKDTLKENVDYIVSYENNINAGEGTIIIQGIGNYCGVSLCDLIINKADQDIEASVEKGNILKTNSYSKINTKGYGKITYESDNNDIASISQGYLNTYAEGEVNVKVTAEGDNNHNPASTTLTVKISDTEQPTDPEKPTDPEQPTDPEKPTDPEQPTDPEKPTEPEQPTDPEKPTEPEQPTDPEKPTDPEEPSDDRIDITKFDVSLSGNKFTYTGAAICPEVTIITDETDSNILMQDIDYTVEYSNNVNVGTATVTITGKGDYRGTITHTFSIKKAANKITANKRTYTVVGNLSKSVTAKISAKAAYGKLKYVSDNRKVVVSSSGKVTIPKGFSGMATVTLTSKSTKNYSSASCKISVVINPAATKFSSVKAGNKKITLKWKKNRSARGYEIQYSTDAAFRSDVVKKSVNKNTTSLTLKKLTSGSKYYIRIRAVNKFKYKGKSRTIYSTWTNVTKSC